MQSYNKIFHPKFIKMNRVLLFYHKKCGVDIVNEHQQRLISAPNSPQDHKLSRQELHIIATYLSRKLNSKNKKTNTK